MEHLKYIVFNKPYGVLCQFTDREGRPTLKDFISEKDVYPVGRLDMDSEGLLLLTNDGELAHRMADPRFKVEKKYLVQVEGLSSRKNLELLERGLLIEGKRTRPAKVSLLENAPEIWERERPIRYRKNIPVSWLEVTISEGRNRQVRKMTAAIGLPCLRLIRTSVGKLVLEGLLPGESRKIKRSDIF